jgi:hypothetical protein
MEIVQDYSDHGRSGLSIAGREGLNQLMADVEATDAFTLTVSRGYLERLLSNPKIERYMERYHLYILQTLRKLLSDSNPISSEAERRAS